MLYIYIHIIHMYMFLGFIASSLLEHLSHGWDSVRPQRIHARINRSFWRRRSSRELVRRTVPTVPWWDGSRKKTTCGRDIPADILGLYWVQDLLMTGMASFRRFQVEWKAIDLDDLWSSEQSDHMQAIVQKGPQPLRGMLRRSARL